MKDLIDFLTQLGVPKSILLVLMILAVIYLVISTIIKVINWAILKNHQWLLNENLRPYFSTSDVERATRYYIPTKFQNVSPLADDEPGKSHLASAKEPLMPMFLNKAFRNKIDNTKYYLILADAGMGKTTFLINLFLSYTGEPIKNLFGYNENQGMKLFPLGSPDIWTDIEKIENKRDTILLLDAFDEDIKAVDDYDARMREILKATKEFKEIVITCRTQFFPSDKEIPDDTGYTTFGGEQGTYKFQRVYLSVFDETDIEKYLKKRFSFFQRSKRKRAFEIVEKSPNLVMRPMLLSYINDFVEADRTFTYSHEIYEVLIDKWIERESKKHGIRTKYGSEEKYRNLLLSFSQALAVNLYQKSEERGGYFITKDDFIKDAGEFQITDVDNYGMSETEVRSKSLLNRNAEGKYKFSHKSILEYFLAKELIQNGKLLSTFDFDGMSATEMFLDEMIEPFRKLKVNDHFLENEFALALSKLTARKILKVKKLKFNQLGVFNPLRLSVFANLEQLIITDEQKYPLLYGVYFYFVYMKELEKISTFNEVRERIELLELKTLSERIDDLKKLELLPMELLEVVSVIAYFRLEKFINEKKDDEIIKEFQLIEQFLKDMKLLQVKLPNCKMIY